GRVPLAVASCPRVARGDARFDFGRVIGFLVGLVGVAALVGFDVSFRDLGAVGEIALVAVGYAAGPIIVSRRLPGAPAVGVVPASLVLTALAYAPLALRQLPPALPFTARTAGAVGAGRRVHRARLP